MFFGHGPSHLTPTPIVPCEMRVELFCVTVPRCQLRTSLQLYMAQGCVHSSCELLEGCLGIKYISHKKRAFLSKCTSDFIHSVSLADQARNTHLLTWKMRLKMKRIYFTTKLGNLATARQAATGSDFRGRLQREVVGCSSCKSNVLYWNVAGNSSFLYSNSCSNLQINSKIIQLKEMC